MIKKLFATFTMIILIGCTVIGSQPVLSFKPINRENLIIFLQDSKNVIFIDTEKDEIADVYKIASNEEVNACYTFNSHYDFYEAGNCLYFTSENTDTNTQEAQRIFYVNHRTGEYKQLPIEDFSEIYDFNEKLWVNINNQSFYEYSPENNLGIQTENINFTFDGVYFVLGGKYYLRSKDSIVNYGSFKAMQIESDATKKIVNNLSPNWTAPFYAEKSDDGIVIKEITSVEKEIITADCFTYTNEELAGSNICYISENLEKNELFIIRCGGGKTTIDKYSKDSESQSWNKSNSKSIDKEIYKNLCKETESDFWIFTMNSDDNRIFIKISKETLEYKEVK
jgi:hypothetical protein